MIRFEGYATMECEGVGCSNTVRRGVDGGDSARDLGTAARALVRHVARSLGWRFRRDGSGREMWYCDKCWTPPKPRETFPCSRPGCTRRTSRAIDGVYYCRDHYAAWAEVHALGLYREGAL